MKSDHVLVLNQFLERLQSVGHTPSVSFVMPARKLRVLYAVNHSFPFSSNGYAVRTHGVSRGLIQAGIDVIVASRPGLPWDRHGFDESGFSATNTIEGVRYIHSVAPSQTSMPWSDYLEACVARYQELINVFKPAVVIAASDWKNALPAALAARACGLPFFYEVRGFWEVSGASGTTAQPSSAFDLAVQGEGVVADAAETVFTLNRFMRDELVRRGVAPQKIALAPNGFEPDRVCSGQWPSLTRQQLGIQADFVVGYQGSFNEYEGLETLIEALAALRASGKSLALLLVGSATKVAGMNLGECRLSGAYRSLAARLGVENYLVLPGRVPPQMTAAYYDLMDVVVIPRKPEPVCELVSPVKPLEAAAHGKHVLMSSVAPLLDLAPLYPGFSYFEKGNTSDLISKLDQLLHTKVIESIQPPDLTQLSWGNAVTAIVQAVRGLPAAKISRRNF